MKEKNVMMKRFTLLTTICLFFFAPLQAQELVIDENNYEEYLDLVNLLEIGYPDTEESRTKKIYLLKKGVLTGKKKVTFSSIPGHYSFNIQPNKTEMANLEEIIINNSFLGIHDYPTTHGTKLQKLTISPHPDCLNFGINLDNGFLTQDNIIFNSERAKIYALILKRQRITDLEPFYNLLSDDLYVLQLNGGKYYRKQYAGVDDGTYNPTNILREIDMTRIPSARLVSLHLAANLLEHLDHINTPVLNNTMLRNNLLWSLDLSSLTITSPLGDPNYIISPQKPIADLTVIKGAAVDGSEDEVRLYLPEGQSELFDSERLVDGSVKLLNKKVKTQAVLGTDEKYFKVANVGEDKINADMDLYAKHNGFTYCYNSRPALTDEIIEREEKSKTEVRDMEVQIKTYPYIMYIHPATKSGTGVNYYSGTLWLDYDAIVPEGTTVWIVTDIDKKAVTIGGTAQATEQLVLEKIGDPGSLIPAGTAMYVRSDNKAGLYDFQKVWKHELLGWDGPGETSSSSDTLWYNKVYTPEQEAELAAQREKIGNRNLLEGYATETTFPGKRQALVLGRESVKGTGMIGFWPFDGTKVPAHRAFISEATYKRVTGDASAKGASFFFNDAETTGITHIKNTDGSTTDDAWYSLDGRKFNSKPTAKGVYIHKDRKEVIR